MLFKMALKHIIRSSRIETKSTIFIKSQQVFGYTGDINIIGRSIAAVKECILSLEGAANEVGLPVSEEKPNVTESNAKR